MLGITAKHADIWNTRSPLEEAKRRSNVLDEKCREIGRDPGEIMRSVWPGQNQLGSLDNLTSYIESFREQGFDDFLFAWPENDDELAVITEAAATVIPGVRG
jgi:alkanesulfonate monooxygenase SsuD/methylene tetrahydromethanopterin reductase-like flavin-dependent oxidoreductase (luciferase family)